MKAKILRTLTTTAVLGMLCFSLATEAQAQRTPGSLGVGVQIGQPSGLSLMYYRPSRMSYDFLTAWDLSDDFLFVNAHGLFERHLGNDENLHAYFGPGVFVGFRDDADNNEETVAGISGRVGLGYLFNRFEVYGQLTPRLALTPDTDGDLGGGVGFRYFF